MRKSLLFICLIALFALQVKAQETEQAEISELSLDQLLNIDLSVAVASTKAQSVFKTPSVVSVITKDDIRNFNYRSVPEAVNNVPGLSIERTYLKRDLPTARGIMQDHYANKVLYMINGVPLWHAVTGEGYLERINIEDVERIEVLKGPASILYGSNAYTGAINIVLKKADNSSQSHIAGGSNNSYDIGQNLSYSNDKFDFFTSVNMKENFGHNKAWIDENKVSGHVRDYTKSKNATVSTRYGMHNLLLNAYEGHESYYGVVPTFASGADRDHSLNGQMVNYTLKHEFKDKLMLQAGATWDYNFRGISRSKYDTIRADIEGYRLSEFIKAIYKVNDNFDVEVGFDNEYRYSEQYRNYYTITKITPVGGENGMSKKDIGEYSVYTQLQYTYNKFLFLGGARYTENELFGNNVSPRAAIIFSVNDRNSLKLMYGESFRTPALFEFYFLSPATVYGSPGLKPETAKSTELTYVTSFNKFFIQATGFYTVYENTITRSRDSTTLLSNGLINTKKEIAYSNGKAFEGFGAELEIKYNNPKIINAFVNYSLMQGNKGDLTLVTVNRVDYEKYNFKFVPQHNISAGLSRNLFSFLGLSTTYSYIDERMGPFAPIANYHIFNAALSFKHKINGNEMSHIISVKNIADFNQQTPEISRFRTLNSVPLGNYRFVEYMLRFNLN
jgi:outer membrane cobalamin receptor